MRVVFQNFITAYHYYTELLYTLPNVLINHYYHTVRNMCQHEVTCLCFKNSNTQAFFIICKLFMYYKCRNHRKCKVSHLMQPLTLSCHLTHILDQITHFLPLPLLFSTPHENAHGSGWEVRKSIMCWYRKSGDEISHYSKSSDCSAPVCHPDHVNPSLKTY